MCDLVEINQIALTFLGPKMLKCHSVTHTVAMHKHATDRHLHLNFFTEKKGDPKRI